MRAPLVYGAGDVRVEEVPDPTMRDPTDAVVRVVRSAMHGTLTLPRLPATGCSWPP